MTRASCAARAGTRTQQGQLSPHRPGLPHPRHFGHEHRSAPHDMHVKGDALQHARTLDLDGHTATAILWPQLALIHLRGMSRLVSLRTHKKPEELLSSGTKPGEQRRTGTKSSEKSITREQRNSNSLQGQLGFLDIAMGELCYAQVDASRVPTFAACNAHRKLQPTPPSCSPTWPRDAEATGS